MSPSASHHPNTITSALPPPCQVPSPSSYPCSCSFPRQTRTFFLFQTHPILVHLWFVLGYSREAAALHPSLPSLMSPGSFKAHLLQVLSSSPPVPAPRRHFHALLIPFLPVAQALGSLMEPEFHGSLLLWWSRRNLLLPPSVQRP